MRPVRWLVAMLDEQVVPLELFGIAAGKTRAATASSRSEAVAISKPSAYVEALRGARFLVRPSASR